jgi:hypothetical protein
MPAIFGDPAVIIERRFESEPVDPRLQADRWLLLEGRTSEFIARIDS